ncbi:hypothetical protein ACIQC3_14350 [Pseudarthrobacter oxydans]|uniref:hypothetical protein n=1 Tax=Pseudarthrobacter oxydans TaxID=1671 RepID=UPI0037F5CC44
MDEWLFDHPDEGMRSMLTELLERRYGTASTVFCTQYAKNDWHQRLGSGVHANAIVTASFTTPSGSIPATTTCVNSHRDAMRKRRWEPVSMATKGNIEWLSNLQILMEPRSTVSDRRRVGHFARLASSGRCVRDGRKVSHFFAGLAFPLRIEGITIANPLHARRGLRANA